MKNTRKKLLVSSVAALLVSAMALSTATFAWFTSSTVATADGMNVRTSKASKLQISKYDYAWNTTVDYGVSNQLLFPASTDDGSDWFTADAAAANESAAKAGTVSSVTNGLINGSKQSGNVYYVKDMLNVINSGDAAVENVKIAFSVPNDYVRVALVPNLVAKDTKVENTNTGVAKTFDKSIYDMSGEAYKAAASITGSGDTATFATTDITATQAGASFYIDLGTLTSKQAKYFDLYVWFEGQDAQCTDASAGDVIDDIQFTVTGDTVMETE